LRHSNLQLSSFFDINDAVLQAVEEDPNIISEQFLISSYLDFDKCAKQLCAEFSVLYGYPLSSSVVKNQAIGVTCYVFAKGATEVTVQISSEGSGCGCHGFAHAKTKWLPDLAWEVSSTIQRNALYEIFR
jgi:hypothetical protein